MCDYPDDAVDKLTPIERSCVQLMLLAAAGGLFLLAVIAAIARKFF